MTTQSDDDATACLETRYWFYFLASSLIVFFAGIIVILTWRIIEHFVGCARAAALGGKTTCGDTESSANIAAKIKWKCEKLVSGQTLISRIVVSLNYSWLGVLVSVVGRINEVNQHRVRLLRDG